MQYIDPYTAGTISFYIKIIQLPEIKHERKSKHLSEEELVSQSMSQIFKPLDGYPVGEAFLVHTQLISTCHFPIILHSVETELVR